MREIKKVISRATSILVTDVDVYVVEKIEMLMSDSEMFVTSTFQKRHQHNDSDINIF